MTIESKDAVQTISNLYSCFTNNGYIEDSNSITGYSEDRIEIKDLVTLPDLTRFG